MSESTLTRMEKCRRSLEYAELIARSNSNIGTHEESIVTSNTDKLEDRTAAILGQIQASVAEYVRTMNEAGALRRREADEAHRQQDQACAALHAVEKHSRDLLDTIRELAASVGKDWLGLVERGLREIAVAQGRAAAETAYCQFETRANSLIANLDLALNRVSEIADANDRVRRAID